MGGSQSEHIATALFIHGNTLQLQLYKTTGRITVLEETGQKNVWCLGLYSCTKPLINKLKTEATDLHSVIT